MPETESQSGAGPNVKLLSDLVRPFNGQGDIMEWLSKLELIADLRDVDRLEKVIPLFLEGSAHCLYVELSDSEKKSAQAIKSALIKAFGTNRFKAYEQFVRRFWHDESVDVYATDLKRLARLGGVSHDDVIMTQFVVGLPSRVSRELRATPKVEKMTLSELIERARELMSELNDAHMPVAFPALGGGPPVRNASTTGSGSAVRAPDGGPDTHGGRSLRCFRCGGPHMKRNCPTKPKFECWTCGQEGHSAKFCSQGNARGGAAAPVAAAPPSLD